MSHFILETWCCKVSRGFFIASSVPETAAEGWRGTLSRAWSDWMRGDGFTLTEVRTAGKAQVKHVLLGGMCCV